MVEQLGAFLESFEGDEHLSLSLHTTFVLVLIKYLAVTVKIIDMLVEVWSGQRVFVWVLIVGTMMPSELEVFWAVWVIVVIRVARLSLNC